MKKLFKKGLTLVLILGLIVALGAAPVFAEETGELEPQTITENKTVEELQAEIKDLYNDGYGTLGRTHKMQAFIMEIALHAKTRNPDFKIIPQDGINLAFVDGDWSKGLHESLISLVDGWGIEGVVGNGTYPVDPNTNQQKYMRLVQAGLMVTDTTSCTSVAALNNYYARAEAWGIIPYPRVGGALVRETLYPGLRWATNGDYFWVEDPDIIGLTARMDGARNVYQLTDAQNYLYHINGRPFDAWETWDEEEAAFDRGDGDRTRIDDSYGNGLLVPIAGGPYTPVGDNESIVSAAIATYGSEWDWWWRAAGYEADQGREVWLETLRNSNYDVIYIDSFYNHRARPENQTPLTRAEVESLKYKPGGGRRQIIAYLSIGSAEQNRWYCQDDWVWVDPNNPNSTVSMKAGAVSGGVYTPYTPPEGEAPAPAWLATGYGGNYPEEAVVQWWHQDWRDIIINGNGAYGHKTTGDKTSSIDRIIDQGFDGVYLDNVGIYSRSHWTAFENYWLAHGGIPGDAQAELVPQNLNYEENPVDIPNPDRGFYRANDGMIVPVTGDGDADPMEVGANPVTVGRGSGGTPAGAQVTTRISHVYFDLRNFSSNAFLQRGTRYNSSYRAPEGVSIKSRGDAEPWAYDTHFDYWKANVLPTWPKGTSQPLTEDALAFIRDKFQQVRDGNGVLMVRFSYDGGGYGWVDANHPQDGYIDACVADVEPDKATLLGHIAQIKPILAEYEDIIMGVDGGWFGPWGEMHSTTFGTSPEANAWLLEAWLDAVPASRSITVQGGAFLSWYNATYGTEYTFANMDRMPAPQPGTPEARFGFFNDSYGFGMEEGEDAPEDWGSLSEGCYWPGSPLGGPDDFDRGRVMTWIRKQNNLYGGEAQGDETLWNTYPFVGWEASYAQTVYLNADYSSSVHRRWSNFTYNEENVLQPMTNNYGAPYGVVYAYFDPVYDGKSGTEYFRDRLGYRLVLREAKASEWVAPYGVLKFDGKIQNVGFGNIVNRKNVRVILKNKSDDTTYSALSNIDAREWRPDLDSRATNTAAWRDLDFQISMATFGQVPAGEYDIYLKINDPKETSANKRCIRFANKGDIWDAELGANLIGSTTVTVYVPFVDDEDTDTAKAAIEAAAYSGQQSEINSEAQALAKVRSIINDLGLTGVNANVFKFSYTPPQAGTANNPQGVNGSLVFHVGVRKGMGVEKFTPNMTMSIAATPYSGSSGSGGGSGSSTTTPPPVELRNPFRDVFKTDWFYDDVLTAYYDDLINGRTANTYVPKGSVTIAEAIKLAACINQLYNNGSVTLANGSPLWYSTYVDYAIANGIITEGQFSDYTAIATRAEFAEIFAHSLPAAALSQINEIKDGDIPDVRMSDSYGPEVYQLYRAGVLRGNDANLTFAPGSDIKRSEVAAIVTRMTHPEKRQKITL